MKICMLTSSHDVYDNRIYYKEILSLKKQFDDICIIAHGDKDFVTKDGIQVRCFKKRKNWHDRMRPMKDMYRLGVEVDADVYHAHEPDAYQVAVKLKNKNGKKAVYDSHEYYPEAFAEHFGKLAPVAQKMLHIYEKRLAKQADMIITVNDLLVNKFLAYNNNVVLLPNYPTFDDKTIEKDYQQKPLFVYAGEQRETRGITRLLEAIKESKADATFLFIGRYVNDEYKKKVTDYIDQNLKGRDVRFIGQIPHPEVFKHLYQADAGFVVLQPYSWRYTNSEPIKLFEYMLSKTAVIGSNFPMFKNIIDKAGCGLTVIPDDPKDIAKIIDYIAEHREEAREMGQKGYEAAVKNYNWNVMENRLIDAYKQLQS